MAHSNLNVPSFSNLQSKLENNSLMLTDLTINPALQKGIEAHKTRPVQEADRLYTTVVNAQAKRPDANHNLGAGDYEVVVLANTSL